MTKIDTASDDGGLRRASMLAAARRKSNARTDSPWWALLFVGPNLVLFTIFIIITIIAAFALSLYDWNLISDPRFVGLRNYTDILNDARALNSVVNFVTARGFSSD